MIEHSDSLSNPPLKKDTLAAVDTASTFKWKAPKKRQQIESEVTTIEIYEVTSGAPEIDYPEIIEVPVIPISPDSIPLNPPK